MGVVVDTCIWVDIERGKRTPVNVAEKIGNSPVYLTPTIVAELQYGVDRAPTAAKRARRLSALTRLRKKPCLVIDHDTGVIFGALAAQLDSQGTPAQHRINDLWIAAVAIQNSFGVLTGKASDFHDIPGLNLITM